MIRRLRLQFVAVTMAAMTLLLLLMLGALNLTVSVISTQQETDMLHSIAARDGHIFNRGTPPNDRGQPQTDSKTPDPRDAIHSFSVRFDKSGEVLEIIAPGEYSSLTDAEMTEIARTAVEHTQQTGRIGGYRYLVEPRDYGTLAVLLDSTQSRSLLRLLLRICLPVALVGVLLLLALTVRLSRWVVRPVSVAFEQQKQFLSDASHELKTPLTIIAASADVLAHEEGTPNKWLTIIGEQVVRMQSLVHDLLRLAEVENAGRVMPLATIDLSRAVLRAALPFESAAFDSGTAFEIDVPDGITTNGNAEALEQMTRILLDNAFKYAGAGGAVSVGLMPSGGRHILTVYNTGAGIPEGDRDRIFERFCRGDASRSRETGGFGLGLAIAKSILDAHGGKIAVESDGAEWTRFVVTLP